MSLEGDANQRWPCLYRWLPRDGRRHFFRPGDYAWADDVYDRFEELLASIESVSPVGLPQKRRTFREERRPDNLLTLRSELLTGYLLARGGVDFSCPAFPDFVCSGRFTGGVEVTTRTKNDREAIELRLRELANPEQLSIKVEGGGPVLGQALVDRVVEESKPLLEGGRGGRLTYANTDLRVSIGRVIDTSIDLNEVVAGWRKELDLCVAQLPGIILGKAEQAAKTTSALSRPLVLLVDASRFASFGSLVGPLFLTDTLPRLAAQLVDLELTPFDALVVAISNLQTNSYTGVMRRQDGLPETSVVQLDILERVLLSHP